MNLPDDIRKPTRRDLLIVLGELQDRIGAAIGAYEDDRAPCRASRVRQPLNEAFDLCIYARSFDPLFVSNGPWARAIKGAASPTEQR